MEDNILEVTDLNVTLNNHKILEHITFKVKRDETLAIIGPNGAGKTILFKALLGLIPYDGKITWQPGLKIGYVPQRVSIEADMPINVYEFLSMKEKNKEKINNVLASVNIFENKDKETFSNFLNKKLGILSGGQLQKVLIAYALLGDPDVILFDEPTSGIDISSEETIYSLLSKLQDKENFTILLISHEMQVVYKYATNVICLNKSQVCFGPPRQALKKESFEKLFGSDIGYYQHHNHHEH